MGAKLVRDSDKLEFEVGESCVIGRSPTADVTLNDGGVSREHAMIRKSESGFQLFDLNSANGCWVNGARVSQPVTLRHGDVVMIAEVVLRFQGEEGDGRNDIDDAIGSRTVMMQRLDTAPMILFVSDIVGYSSLSEKMNAEDVASVLREWYDHCRVVLEVEGGATIDKFLGDSVFAYWHVTDATARERAVEAARGIMRSDEILSDTHRKMLSDIGRRMECGVGIHIGEAAVGAMTRGTQTALGDAVNVAFRIESLTRKVERPVIVTADFLEGWDEGQDQFDSCGEYMVKGISRPIEIMALKGY